MTEARIFNLERFAIDDGPGIRTVVFMQGCPLHCPWCSNPESQCSDSGRSRSVKDIMDEVERDKAYYEASGGGVTFSGGEPFRQTEALAELLKEARRRSIPTAVETSAMAGGDEVRGVLPYVDLWLVDIKHTDAALLKKVTGADLSIWERNLALMDPVKVVLRRPCIPGFNMDAEHFDAAFRMALDHGIRRMDLLPYHTLGVGKYRRMGLAYPYEGHCPVDRKQLEPFKTRGESLGLDIRIV